jgi:hypothetical protein
MVSEEVAKIVCNRERRSMDSSSTIPHNPSRTFELMPIQETFLDRDTAGHRVQVIKTYDAQYARESFGHMTDGAKEHLWRSLSIDETYDSNDLPETDSAERDDFLLEELMSAGREDWNKFSYFVVVETRGERIEATYVSGDWPSAEAFANAEPPTGTESFGSHPAPNTSTPSPQNH